MFAGIIEGRSRVLFSDAHPAQHSGGGSSHRLVVDLGACCEGVHPGASIAVNGVCLTVRSLEGAAATFDVVPETWARTNLRYLQPSGQVNIERSLRLGDRVDGHLVQGHVEGVAPIVEIERGAGDYKLWFRAPAALVRFLVAKGSIALDGTSLTLVDVGPQRCSVVLIPTTLEWTVLGERRVGDLLNLETDATVRVVVQRVEQIIASRDGGGVVPATSSGRCKVDLAEGASIYSGASRYAPERADRDARATMGGTSANACSKAAT